MYGIVYKVTNKINDKIYIGITTTHLKTRMTQHVSQALKHPNRHNKFHNAILKYGRDNFISEQIDSAESKQELAEKEQYYIKFYNSNVVGYNMTVGGEGAPGYHHTEETKKIISKCSKERIITDEIRHNMSEAQKKVKHSKASIETKLKMSASRKGHITTDETRQKISQALTGKVRTIEQNKSNSDRQIGKHWMYNDDLKITVMVFPKNLPFAQSLGFVVGRKSNYKIIKQAELLLLN